MTDSGVLIILSGPSGSGKDTVLNKLTENRDDIKISISMTTRQKRNDEIDGLNYYFVSREYFEKKIADNNMLEYAEYADNLYGTPKAPVDEMLRNGKAVILKIEVQGAEKIRKIYPEVISIFLMPPSVRVLEERLRGRNSEDEETLNHRLVIAREEIRRASEYDYIVINDTVENAVAGIETIINAERQKTFRNKKIISEVINNV
ncbi:MAG: guanylate kinase [Oscillospiraceae bacterium]|nr:guanylate kinase [Clostridiaceae bacterium]MDY5947862.1 guanylate kinase [Oscillospiraceae bacterium]